MAPARERQRVPPRRSSCASARSPLVARLRRTGRALASTIAVVNAHLGGAKCDGRWPSASASGRRRPRREARTST